ncbi:hypothetical protein TeGR_g3077, partial [Tetraparma gracilis]
MHWHPVLVSSDPTLLLRRASMAGSGDEDESDMTVKVKRYRPGAHHAAFNGRQTWIPLNVERLRQKISNIERLGELPDDLVMSLQITEPFILYNLLSRFEVDKMYTAIGDILVAINPFRDIPGLHSSEKMDEYRDLSERQRLKATPHVFNIADMALHKLTRSWLEGKGRTQAVVISGESGAGKTEQWMKIRFSASSERSLTMVGCHTDHYLLEKARVTSHAPGERNFHVFYQVLRGCPPEQREALHITSKETTDFDVLLAADGSKTSYEGIDDAEDFSNMTRAFSNLGFSPDESEELLRVVVGLLFLGNMRFAEGGDGEHAVPVDDCTLDNNNAADLLGLDPDFLARSLSTKVRTVRSETITSPLTAPASDAARDALSKKTYSLTFDWLMRRINTSMHVPDGAIESFIGILDIFGFEIFEDNRFEQ